MEVNQPQFKRTRKLISRPIQGRIGLTILLYLVIYTAVIFLAFLTPLALDVITEAPLKEQESAARVILAFHKALWPALIFAAIFIALHSLLVSHKIAGPVFRFEQTLKDMTAGQIGGKVRLRSGDYFVGLMEAFNALNEQLQSNISRIKEHNDALLQETGNLIEIASRSQVSQELMEGLKRLQAVGIELKAQLEGYKLG